MYVSFFKRLFDFSFAFIILVIASPILVIITIILTIVNNGKPFFFQRRPGLNKKLFKIIKFKTMNDKKDKHGNLLCDAARLTKTGSFVRKTSLDEVPQLINVMKGNMSLIGPRPLLIEYLDKYSEDEKQRHQVKPGITGLAQVVDNLSGIKHWKKSMKLDIFYISHVSFLLDIKILWRTVMLIIFKKKQYQDFKKFYE